MISDAEFVALRAFDRTVAQNADDAQRIINQKNTELLDLQEIIREQRHTINQQSAGIAGRNAQIGAFVKAHPGSPLLVKTGKVYPSGKNQTAASVLFEKAYDDKARELGIKEPSGLRPVAVNPQPVYSAGPSRR